ncbi:hypothetical protein TVAG_583220 [Trichomonas vaginalis G3]|uniref:COPI associated protein n=1 Tax=Trichomonas vaginalis (strain ATCC PRA-98 / G3) TaxID=412133 RepID=A2GCD6_TRIV3|nr:hypothetical protein TVAGG3_0501410 [Trichomonas vaginalis G3]XP_051094474.1 hypothetical protein TVAGG3_0501700 [Trichomonas vaginalis G3]EAX85182.1 hypothetical protein TVAG_583220 [Trichomonas vaginalis G3]KAI5517109.1 hypothetical protein TVAGG3_0501410 [Trichomonas vaginalis G3]KAI5517134.1 hypothetical protein TVAGG3_0501700 [Trichomonas vaginalis G3]|eukprot:XP_001298112.1 hypothetical protein [Trichomonas vaginalis G3]
MACVCDLTVIAQIIAIVGGIFAIIVGCFWFKDAHGNFFMGVNGFFDIVFGILVILTEVFRPAFFKYFGFMVLFWGKIIMFFILFLRCFTTDFKQYTIQGIGWIIDVICMIIFAVFAVWLGGGTKSLLQKDGVEMGTSSSDLFKSTTD